MLIKLVRVIFEVCGSSGRVVLLAIAPAPAPAGIHLSCEPVKMMLIIIATMTAKFCHRHHHRCLIL